MTTSSPQRLTSLDQFRGYTMFGMLLVNFLGGYAVCPRILRHTHDYCSYADTIMPHFLFAAGFAMRLSLGRRIESGGKMPWGRAVRRILGLALVAMVWYAYGNLDGIQQRLRHDTLAGLMCYLFKRELFATLMHIAATSLWILPVITASWQVRVAYAVGSALLHVLLSWWFNFQWVYAEPPGLDGGPLGFLTWTVCALSGTLACDAVRSAGPRCGLKIALCGFVVMVLGWVISFPTTLYNVHGDQSEVPRLAPDGVIPAWERLRTWDGTLVEPPFVPPPDSQHRQWNYWMMAQRPATLSYLTFTAGFSLVVYAVCLWLCDGLGLRLPIFRTLGTNSLAAYIFADIVGWTLESTHLFPEATSSPANAALGFVCFATLVCGVCRFLEWRGWYIRV